MSTDLFYEFGPFRLDPLGRVLLREGRMVSLPPKVLDTLVVLVENHGRLVEKEKLIRSVWPDTYVDDNSLMHNVSVLRKTLGNSPEGKSYIETAPRRGYRFTSTVRTTRDEPPPRNPSLQIGLLYRFAPMAGAALLIAVVLPAAVWVELRGPAVPALKISPLTSYPGTEASPTFSPDGHQVAFVWNGEKQDQFDIYVKTIGVDPPRRLTSDTEQECHLAWSPDGAWVAFAHCDSDDTSGPPGGVGPYLMPSTGGVKHKIGYLHEGLNAFGRPFVWTPDSKGLIKEKVLAGTTSLVLLSIETGAELGEVTRPLPGARDIDPGISPDGRSLAFVRQEDPGLSDIYLVSLDLQFRPKGQPKRLTFENDYVANPVWTNNGRELLDNAGYQGARGEWRVIARPGSQPRQVPALAQIGLQLALSREGELVYSRRYQDLDIWRADLFQGGSPTPSPLIASTFSDSEPHYSPDGKHVAFQSNRSGAAEIWISNADGTGAVQLTSLGAIAGSPAWSPDGSEVAFDCRVGDTVDIYVAAVADKRVRRLTRDPGAHITPAWSHDGKWVYFASKRSGRLEIWKLPSSGGEAGQVTKSGGFFVFESPNGKFLIYSKNGEDPTSLWRKSLENGKEEQIIDSIRYWSYFAVFDDGVYFVPARASNAKFDSFQVAFYDFSTGHVRTVAEIGKWPGVGFSIAPDRRSVLFAPSETHGADLMLIENFR